MKLGTADTRNGGRLPALTDGERVLLYDEKLEVETTVIYDPGGWRWMTQPDDATRRDLPAPAAAEPRVPIALLGFAETGRQLAARMGDGGWLTHHPRDTADDDVQDLARPLVG